jgi:NMT1/THI5 like
LIGAWWAYWIGIAAAKGWFREAGLNVQLVDCNADYSGSEKDLVEGRLDTNTFVLFDLLDYIAQGAVLVGVINADYSAGSEKLVARAGIEQIGDLKGKKIGVPHNSYLRYVLEVAIGRVGLKPKDVQIVDLQPEKVTEEVRQFAKIDKILDLRDNELAFSFAAGFDSLHGAVRQMNDFMIARGMTAKKLDSSQFLEGSFLEALK